MRTWLPKLFHIWQIMNHIVKKKIILILWFCYYGSLLLTIHPILFSLRHFPHLPQYFTGFHTIKFGGTNNVVQSSMCWVPSSHMFLTKRRKWAGVISILIIRSHHLLKKLSPAAVKQSQTSLCSSCSTELTLFSSSVMYTLWSCGLSLSWLHPIVQLSNMRLWVAQSRLKENIWSRITNNAAEGQDDKALIYYITSYTLSLRQPVPPLLTQCSHSWQSSALCEDMADLFV